MPNLLDKVRSERADKERKSVSADKSTDNNTELLLGQTIRDGRADAEPNAELADMQKEADLLGLIQSDTGEQGHASGEYVAFRSCPICRHKDCFRFYPTTNTWACFGGSNENQNADGRDGGGYLKYLLRTGKASDDAEAVKMLREVTGHPYNPNNEVSVDNRPSELENAADVIGTPYEPVPALCDGLIDLEDVVEVVGEGGLGKSWFLIGCAIATAAGHEFAGMSFQRGNALFVNPEIQKPKFRNRLRKVFDSLGLTREDIGDRLRFKTYRGTETNIEAVTQDIETSGYSLICLDSLYMLHDEDENDARSMKHVIMSMIETGSKSGATVMTTHHTGKGASGSKRAVDRARGSSVLHGGPDVVLTLDELSVDEGSGAWELLRTYDRRNERGKLIFAKPVRLTFAKVRDHEDRPPTNLIFRWPTFVVDDTGELDECNIVGSAADNAAKAARAKADRSKEMADTQAQALDEIISDLEEQGIMPTRAACLPRLNEVRETMDLDPITKDTFAKYTRNGGILPHRVRSDGSNALWRPQFDTEDLDPQAGIGDV